MVMNLNRCRNRFRCRFFPSSDSESDCDSDSDIFNPAVQKFIFCNSSICTNNDIYMLNIDRNVLKQYVLKPGYSFHSINTDRAILLNETEHLMILDELDVKILREINRGDSEKHSILNSKIPPEEILFALRRLKGKGYILNKNEYNKKYTCLYSITPGISFNDVFSQPVIVKSISSFFIEKMNNALCEAGFKIYHTDQGSKIAIILCNDYIEQEVTTMITHAFNRGVHCCFPIKLSGRRIWIGPLFKKGQKPCWHCLQIAIRKNRPVENYLSKMNQDEMTIIPKYLSSTVSLQFGISTALIQLLKNLTKPKRKTEIITIDIWDLAIKKHYIRTYPQCDVCGDPSIFSKQVNSPIELQDIPRDFTKDGGYRIIEPEKTWDNYKHLISPVSGIITHIDRYAKKYHFLRPVWKTTYFINPYYQEVEKDEHFAKNSYGKGHTSELSRTSALCEAIERYASLYTGEEPQIRGTYDNLESIALHPEKLLNFSTSQYSTRNELNKKHSPQKIPLPLNPDKEISWTPVRSLTNNCKKFVPLQFCYFLTPTPKEENVCPFSSNGNAAGNCLEEAILQGILELIERDAAAIWWYNRIPRPGINIESFNDMYFNTIKKHYADLGWDLWILDLTHDLNIPTAIALAKNTNNNHFIVGLGCHLDMYLAIQRAITEMHQTFDPKGIQDPVWTEDELEHHAFINPNNEIAKSSEMWQLPPKRSLKEDILYCVERIKKAGMEVFVLNYTRPDIGVPTSKVIIPGMRHFWKRFGPGRIYSVPVQMGWLKKILPEDNLNPIELPL